MRGRGGGVGSHTEPRGRAAPAASSGQERGCLRFVQWSPPLPIPGLSRAARQAIKIGESHPRLRPQLRKYYEERATRLRAFVSSADFRAFIGASREEDGMVAEDLSPFLGTSRFRQTYAVARGWVPMMDGSVNLHLSADGAAVESLSSTFDVGFAPLTAVVNERSAVESAINLAIEFGLSATTASDVVELLGYRERAGAARGRDQLLYRVMLYDERAPSTRRVQALVDAATGVPIELEPLAADAELSIEDQPVLVPVAQVGFPVFSWIQCLTTEGQGLDAGLKPRQFSTTWGLGQVVGLGSTFLPWSLVSCDEGSVRGLAFRDVITFVGTELKSEDGQVLQTVLDPARDLDNTWLTATQQQLVQSQFWGEHILKYFRGMGYQYLLHNGQPARFWAQFDDKPDEAQHAETLHPSDPLIKGGKVVGDDFSGQGLIRYGGAGNVLSTGGDVAVLAHEFAHKFTWDQVWYPTEPKTVETGAISEGLSECFAMETLARGVMSQPAGVLDTNYAALGDEAPFHLAVGSYKSASIQTGFPNLSNPAQSVSPFGTSYRSWAGDYSTSRHENSTLLAGPCKLLVTGGDNPTYSQHVVVPGPGGEVSLGYEAGLVNRAVAHERLERLLYTTVIGQKFGKESTFEMIRLALAEQANVLAKSEWNTTADMGERVWRAFAAFGFGRDEEAEGNSVATIAALGADAAKNVIGVGELRRRDIAGNICKAIDAEDAFVLNERLYGSHSEGSADTLSFDVEKAAGLDVRVYRGEPCEDETSDVVRPCARDHQLWPPVNASTGIWSMTGQVATGVPVLRKSGGAIPPGDISNWERIYVVVRPGPQASCLIADYVLSVTVSHQNGFY